MPAKKENQSKDKNPTPLNETQIAERTTLLQEVLTARKVDFTPENTLEELEGMVSAITDEVKEKLTALEVEFDDDAELEELEQLLADEEAKRSAPPKQEDADLSANKAKKSSDEVREERKSARLAAKEALSDIINVYASIATQYGPAFVVVGMPRIDVKAFGKKVIFDTKLDLGTRVNNTGKEIGENEEVDRDGNVIENTEE